MQGPWVVVLPPLWLFVTAMVCGLLWLLGLPCARCLSPGSAAQLGLSTRSCVGVASLSGGSCSQSLWEGKTGTVGVAFLRHRPSSLAEMRGSWGVAV